MLITETVQRASIVRDKNIYIIAIKTDKQVKKHSEHTSFDTAFRVWRELEGIK